mmetsp:Transcript_43437/g.93052  ORF Transcript_43437/g.93052 Transcript_43437/m.93052 type:complete len:348 (+) Transcript_43437:2673-3716(+)
MHEDVPQDVFVRVHALKLIATQCVQAQLANSLKGGIAFAFNVADEFPDQGVVVHARAASFVEGSVHSHALAGRLLVGCHLRAASRGQGDAALDGEAPQLGGSSSLPAGKAQLGHGVATRDLQLSLHDVDACHLLRDGVFNLHARVDFHKDKPGIWVAQVATNHELNGADALVVAIFDEADSTIRDSLPELWVHPRRSALHDFLVTKLHAAIPLEQVHDTAVGVGYDLNLDVVSIGEELLEEDSAIAESRLRFAGASIECIHHFLLLRHQPHASTTATKGSFVDDRQRDVVFLAVLNCLFARLHERRSSQDWHLAPFSQLSGCHFVPQQGDGVTLGADKLDASFSARV